MATEKTRQWQQSAARRFVLGAAAIAVGCLVAACSSGSAPSAGTADVPLQAGKQTTLPLDAMGSTAMGADAKNVLYLGGSLGISTLAPGAAQPTPMKLAGHPNVLTLAVASDGTLYFVTLDGVVETLPPGAVAPVPLPFGKLQRFGQLVVAHDGAVYLGDDVHDKLLKLAPGATAPTELPVSGVDAPGHMAIDGDGNLFVSMSGKVVKIAKDATTAEPVAGVTDHVGGLAVDAAGNLYATDVTANTVSRRPAGGGDWTQLPFSGLQSPTAVTVDGDGNVYVIDGGRQIVRLAAK